MEQDKYLICKVVDADVHKRIQRLVEKQTQYAEAITAFVTQNTSAAVVPRNIAKTGNAELFYRSFDYQAQNIKHFPEDTFKDFLFSDHGILATPDDMSPAGAKLLKQQQALLRGFNEENRMSLRIILDHLKWGFNNPEPYIILAESNQVSLLVFELVTPKARNQTPIKYSPPACLQVITTDDLKHYLQ